MNGSDSCFGSHYTCPSLCLTTNRTRYLITGCLYIVEDCFSQAHKIETPVLFIYFNTIRTNDNFQQVYISIKAETVV